MKKGCFALMFLLLSCEGCSPDSLVNTIDMEPLNNNETGSSDTTTVAPKFDDSILEGDSISGTALSNRPAQYP